MPETVFPQELKSSYDIRETIGSGGFAKVKLGIHRLTNEKVAIKMMNKTALDHDLPRVYTEISTMKRLCHQNICQLYEVVETTDEIHMVLEYAPGGELFDYIVANDRLKEEEARGFLRQIVSAVAYMHSEGYAHRDLKPENLLLDEDQVIKLIDFGLVGKPEGGMTSKLETCCGSPAYAAPELISGIPYLGNEADLWSLGVLLYALLCGFLPFDDDNTYKLYKAIQKGEYEIPDWLSPTSVDLIGQLLKTDPKKRATVKDVLLHSWTNKGYAAPVNWKTRVKKDKPDQEVIAELALFYGVSADTMTSLVKEYKYDDLTATYFLLCKKKSRGETPRLTSQFAKNQIRKRKDMIAFEKCVSASIHEKEDRNCINPPTILVDSEDDVFPPDLRDLRKPRSCTLPPQLPETPPVSKMLTVMPCENSHLSPFLPKKGFESPKRMSRDRAYIPNSSQPVSSSSSNYEFGHPISPETKIWSQSLDRDLDKSPWANEHAIPAPRSSSSRRFSQKAIFDSIEGGLNKFLGAFTPRRSSSAHPRKVKALYNVTTTTNKGADEVLAELQKVVSKREGWLYKISGYTMRCKTVDQRGKVLLDFELEVCEIPRIDLLGIRRKRLKGDTWAYKKMCEDILKEADL